VGSKSPSMNIESDDVLKAHRRVTSFRRKKKQSAGHNFVSDAMGWISVVLGIAFLLTLVSYDPSDPSFFTETSQHRAANLLGLAGAQVSAFGIQLFGICSYFFPFCWIYLGVQLIRNHSIVDWVVKIMGATVVWFSLLVIMGGFRPFTFKNVPLYPGGTFGIDLWVFFTGYLNPVGTYLLLLAVAGLALMMVTQLTMHDMSRMVMGIGLGVGKKLGHGFKGIRQAWDERQKSRMNDSIIRRELAKLKDKDHKRRKSKPKKKTEPPIASAPEPKPIEVNQKVEGKTRSRQPAPPHEPAKAKGQVSVDNLRVEKKARKGGGQRAFEFMENIKDTWRFPSSDFFNKPLAEHGIDESELMNKAKALANKFKEFGVTGEMKAIHPGPVVTTYEFKPDAGIKYSKIVNLTDDLCLALGAESIRIDRMPGRYSIGMEVPNSKRELITFREMIEHKRFQNESSKLMLAVGKTIDGSPFYSNLAKMPHLLIAGQTGSGKSVGINAMIASMLMRAKPDEVKLILIDPKMVEMGIYADIPHLLTPVVTDPHEASNALKWAVAEMETRYRVLAGHNFRNLDQYNQAVRLKRIKVEEGQEPPEPLPVVVVVIDELADLMMVARGEVEESIARIAQKSRAVGLHLILATQRPSVDIITGVIKSNLPSRLSYRVAQKNDSRIILDCNGAETLLGKGDALFLPPGTSRLVRIHAPFLSEAEILRLVEFLKNQGQPSYQHEILKQKAEESLFAGGGTSKRKDDPKYDKAARLVVRSGQASISYLQRKLSLGYARAAKLVDMMEEDGIVGPNVGSKARDILVPADYFDGVDGQLRDPQ